MNHLNSERRLSQTVEIFNLLAHGYILPWNPYYLSQSDCKNFPLFIVAVKKGIKFMQNKQNCTFESKIVYAQFSLQQAYLISTFQKVSKYFLLKPSPWLIRKNISPFTWSCCRKVECQRQGNMSVEKIWIFSEIYSDKIFVYANRRPKIVLYIKAWASCITHTLTMNARHGWIFFRMEWL